MDMDPFSDKLYERFINNIHDHKDLYIHTETYSFTDHNVYMNMDYQIYEKIRF
jgi:hypothetical protein